MRLAAIESSDERSCRKCRPHRWHTSLVLRGELIRSTHHAREMIIVDWRSHKSRTHEHSEGSTIQALSKEGNDANRSFSSVLKRPSLQSITETSKSYSEMTSRNRREVDSNSCGAKHISYAHKLVVSPWCTRLGSVVRPPGTERNRISTKTAAQIAKHARLAPKKYRYCFISTASRKR